MRPLLYCRPGDLAVGVEAVHPGNIGRIVRVRRLSQPGTPGPGRVADALWLVRSAQPLLWSIGGRFVQAKTGPVPDLCLRPIRGPGDARALALARQQDLFEAVF